MNKFIIYFCGGGHKPLFKMNRQLPHPQMAPRKEFNIHVFGYRVCLIWGRAV